MMALAKTLRLRKEKDFKTVFIKGKIFKGSFLNLRIFKNNLNTSRFGFVISVKISKKAVLRNKTKRRLKECARLNLARLKPGFDVVIVATRKDITNQKSNIICEELILLLEKSGAME